jgi:hypothetical protein
MERFDTELILTQRQMILSLVAVRVHQQAMSILTATIMRQDELANRNTGSNVLAKVDLAEAVESV